MTTPRPFHYCRICHRNFTDYEWKKHRFNPKHKQRLEDKLADVEVSLEHLLSPTDDVTLQDLDFDATSFECYFCEDYSLLKNAVEEGHDSTASDVYVSLNLSLLHFIFAFSAIILTPPPGISTAIWTHLAGEKHRAVVQHYFAEYSPPPLYQPHRYWLKKSLLKFKLAQYARVKRARDHEGDHLLTLVTRDSESEQQSRATPLTQPSDSVLSNYTLPDTHMTRGKRRQTLTRSEVSPLTVSHRGAYSVEQGWHCAEPNRMAPRCACVGRWHRASARGGVACVADRSRRRDQCSHRAGQRARRVFSCTDDSAHYEQYVPVASRTM